MEIVLQWLDELDDFVFAGFSIRTRLRRFCLAMALITAVAIPVLLRLGVTSDAAPALLSIPLAFLIGWAFLGSVPAGRA